MTAIKVFIRNSVSVIPKMFHFTIIIPSNTRIENFSAYSNDSQQVAEQYKAALCFFSRLPSSVFILALLPTKPIHNIITP